MVEARTPRATSRGVAIVGGKEPRSGSPSKIARCELTLRRGATTTVLHSSRAAFEILDDTAPPGVQPAV
jgi:hypothetical protein